MTFENASDESLLQFYESVRRQVDADKQAGGRYRFVGEYAKQYAEKLRKEMDRRGLKYTPIVWPIQTK
jgi:predicted helicase